MKMLETVKILVGRPSEKAAENAEVAEAVIKKLELRIGDEKAKRALSRLERGNGNGNGHGGGHGGNDPELSGV